MRDQDTEELSRSLSPREKQVFALVRQGRRNAEIANALGIASGTVKIHLKNVMHKLKAERRYDLIAMEPDRKS